VALERTLESCSDVTAISEVTFVSTMVLSRFEGLETRAFFEPMALLAECGAAVGHTRRSLAALDEAVAVALDIPTLCSLRAELTSAFEIRRAYSTLRRRILSSGDPDADALYRRFRAAGTWIAMLIGWEVYGQLRFSDRLVFRQFQRRILEWMGDQGQDPRQGALLWSDLSCFLHMLSGINRRQELIDHDRTFLSELCRHDLRSPNPTDLSIRLGVLAGLDDELDDLLELAPAPTFEQLRPVLQGLCRRFAVSGRSSE
jgi:hypothetical protein